MRILVVDDQEAVGELCRTILAEDGYEIQVVPGGEKALQIVESQEVDLVLSDVQMPGMNGIELLRAVMDQGCGTDVILMTGYGTLTAAVEAIKLGAYDYIEKPLRVDRLSATVKRLAEVRALRLENATLQSRVSSVNSEHGMVGNSRSMMKVFDGIERVAKRRYPVLITGETGTGKELIARAIHNSGLGPQCPFVAVDCGALSEGTIESELFGHVRGAYTGSIGDRRGLLETSGGGTLFLDEVGELSPALQVKLLRVLQSNEFRPLGADKMQRFRGRVLAATNTDFNAAMASGRFRPELFFRLNVYSIEVPPLRNRRSDIRDLIQHFIAKHGEDRVMTSSPDVDEVLSNQNWPGNIRELESCIVRMIVNCEGRILEKKHIPRNWNLVSTKDSEHSAFENAERSVIADALATTDGSVSEAAKKLGISRATLYRKMAGFGLKTD